MSSIYLRPLQSDLVIKEVKAVLFPIQKEIVHFKADCNVNVISTQSNQTVHVSFYLHTLLASSGGLVATDCKIFIQQHQDLSIDICIKAQTREP